ncbi:MAG: hypothetical protein ACJ75B_12795 [Flavisolibacter sp.]
MTGCGKIQNPEFRRIDHFGLKKINLQQATIGFRVSGYNPNHFGLTVKEAAAEVYVDSIYLGRFIQDSAIDIRKGSEFSVPFSGNISLRTALNLKIEDLAQKDILVKADGSARVGKAGLFVTKPIHYQGKHRLEIKL